jgi:hypothetical protein
MFTRDSLLCNIPLVLNIGEFTLEYPAHLHEYYVACKPARKGEKNQYRRKLSELRVPDRSNRQNLVNNVRATDVRIDKKPKLRGQVINKRKV